jgi:hypothetical protein
VNAPVLLQQIPVRSDTIAQLNRNGSDVKTLRHLSQTSREVKVRENPVVGITRELVFTGGCSAGRHHCSFATGHQQSLTIEGPVEVMDYAGVELCQLPGFAAGDRLVVSAVQSG